jgi:hypothetical protein
LVTSLQCAKTDLSPAIWRSSYRIATPDELSARQAARRPATVGMSENGWKRRTKRRTVSLKLHFLLMLLSGRLVSALALANGG